MRMRLSIVLLAIASALSAQAAKPAAKAAPAAAPAGPTFSVPPRTAGSVDAPIVIEVWTDFECPTCKLLYMNTLKPLIPEYCATGKVYLIHQIGRAHV